MKKIISLTLLFVASLLLSGCSNNNYLKEVSLSKLYEMVENNETFILEISQDGCSHCASFNPVFKKVLNKYNVEARYLNISKITEAEYNKFKQDFNNNEDLGTPTVMFFVNGHEKTTMNRIVGSASEKEIIRKLKQNDYIEE